MRANLMWTATLALNGLIGAGVPQDWATHMLGHELTVLHGLDHAQTLAVILPAMLQIRREEKREKLLQYADRVWGCAMATQIRASISLLKIPAVSMSLYKCRRVFLATGSAQRQSRR